MSNHKPEKSWFKNGILMFIIGSIIHFTELYILWKKFQIIPIHDYLLGTYFMGFGFSILALSNKEILQRLPLSNLGKYTLGIYLVHYIFLDILNQLNKYNRNILNDIFKIFIVYVLSLLFIKLMYANKYLSKIIK